MLLPQVEEWLDRQLERSADDLDADIAVIIDTLGRLRSDGAPGIIVGPAGAHFIFGQLVPANVGAHDAILVGDPVRAPGVDHGVHQDGQEHAGA
jgi:hypothetical protein